MRITRRLPERCSSAVPAMLAALSLLSAMTAMTSSCSSGDDSRATFDGGDTTDGSNTGASDAESDAALADVVTDGGLALVDAAPLAITCQEPPCAVALTTTLRSADNSREEGYCALLSDGTVACWGTNTAGQLGSGDAGVTDSPIGVRVPGLSGITAIDHTCAVGTDGAVWCWGLGPFLQSDASATSTQSSPVRLPLSLPAEKVAVTSATACAILQDQSTVCWGSNVGLQVNEDPSTYPGANMPPSAISVPAGAKDVAIGTAAFARYDDGSLLSWGSSPGVGRATSLSPDGHPTRVLLDHVSMVDTIDGETCAVANGVGWCWGVADPTSSVGLNPDAYARALPAAVAIPEPITRIATSRSLRWIENSVRFFVMHRWCATSVSGAVYCWGQNNTGQAGDGTKEFALSAVRATGLPAPAAEVKIMPYSTCAILTNGKVYCWGNNSNGQLGAGLPKGSSIVPVEVVLP